MAIKIDTFIQISEKAREELLNLKVGKENFLRLWVVEGGCKGKTYQAALDNQQEESDRVIFEDEALKVVSDSTSHPFLQGLVIDYSDDLTQGGFRFVNPNATSSCGCGSSFCS